MSTNSTAARTPFTTTILIFGSLLGAPLALFIVFTQWADSWQRQLAAAIGIGALIVLSVVKRKMEALLLTLFFSTQFEISLLSIPIAEQAVFQVMFSDLLLGLLVIAALESSVKPRFDLVATLFTVLVIWHGACALVISVNAAHSFLFTYWEFKYLLAYLVVSSWEMRPELSNKLVVTAALVLLCQGALAAAQLITGRPLGLVVFGEQDVSRLFYVAGGLRVSGTLGATNAFAGYMAMLLVFVMPFVMREILRFRNVGFSVGFGALVVALSRAGWLSFLCGAIVSTFGLVRGKLVRWPKVCVFAIAGVLLIGIALWFYEERIRERFEDAGAVASAMGRFYQFETAFPILTRFPVTGIGAGITEFFGAWNERQASIANKLPGVSLANQPHNSLLQYSIEGGVVGGLLFAVLAWAVVTRAIRINYRKDWDQIQRTTLIGASSASMAFIFHTMFGTEINHHQSMLAFFLLLGVATALRNLNRNLATKKGAT